MAAPPPARRPWRCGCSAAAPAPPGPAWPPPQRRGRGAAGPGGAGGCRPGTLRDGARRPHPELGAHPEAAAGRGQRRGLLRRFMDGAFDPRLTPTVGVDFKTKKMVLEGRAVQLAIWKRIQLKKFSVTQATKPCKNH
ncbi:uncharacterized protein [Taeniopygia guttata]|uniref:uncharacterized protein isoform X2 n=1 Tax=Taeniopygia guttata TaxID=59729 RepID=UPI003BB9153D